ncbi:helix-turn-helix domain-containing protein [Paenibacillus sp. UMB7766-LJ446]|uniref:helix-turn-helix domain-containing protein n=1 Tax=Paenibacillus sp. UMB7766-LJ446 TaxID=3046313 RepID=UPI00254A72CD|nr:helix-turn-helix domain-containing protein [Paenibacillus sp. UMB7766-LJ446]MDK8193740.1 helix-turn-helix domain-containing protein [Paenibacillus sp. UMB7766-LJ446]
MDLAEKILELMEEQGITTYRLSKETGVSYTGLTKILSRQTKHPQIDSIQAIANYFSKPVDYFTDQEEDHDKPEWATTKDMRDFKKMLEEDEPIMFDGVPMSAEDKEKVKRVMEALFWEAKELNKKTYGRKKKED